MARRRIPAEELCVERIQVQVGIGYDYVQCSNKGKYLEAGLLDALTVANDTLQGLDACLASSALDDWHWRNLSAAIDGAKAALKEATKEPEVR